MRIDVENGIVWCNSVELDWYKSYGKTDAHGLGARIKDLAVWGWGCGLKDAYGDEVVTWEDVRVFDENNDQPKLELIKALCSNYAFKLEKPKVYYWRKRAEHLAFFEKEKQSSIYLNVHTENNNLCLSSSYENGYYRTTFTVEEAKELLKDDFDKFEKVSDYDKTI